MLNFIFDFQLKVRVGPDSIILSENQMSEEIYKLQGEYFPELLKFLKEGNPELYLPLTCLIYELGLTNHHVRCALFENFKTWDTQHVVSGRASEHVDMIIKQLEQNLLPDLRSVPK